MFWQRIEKEQIKINSNELLDKLEEITEGFMHFIPPITDTKIILYDGMKSQNSRKKIIENVC